MVSRSVLSGRDGEGRLFWGLDWLPPVQWLVQSCKGPITSAYRTLGGHLDLRISKANDNGFAFASGQLLEPCTDPPETTGGGCRGSAIVLSERRPSENHFDELDAAKSSAGYQTWCRPMRICSLGWSILYHSVLSDRRLFDFA